MEVKKSDMLSFTPDLKTAYLGDVEKHQDEGRKKLVGKYVVHTETKRGQIVLPNVDTKHVRMFILSMQDFMGRTETRERHVRMIKVQIEKAQKWLFNCNDRALPEDIIDKKPAVVVAKTTKKKEDAVKPEKKLKKKKDAYVSLSHEGLKIVTM